jgi:hypothetical protein
MKRILCLLAITTTCAFGQLQRVDDSVTTAAKNVPTGAQAQVLTAPYAKISICGNPNSGSPCQNTVPVFADLGGTQPLTQPLIADAQGRYGYFISPGTYTRSYQSASGTDLGTLWLTIAGPLNPLNKTQINSDLFSGSDIGARMTQAQAFLAGVHVTISINTADAVTTPFTLLDGNDLQINAVVTIHAGIVSTLAGNNRISCSSGGVLTIATGSPFVSTGSNITIDHCHASGDATANASLLVTTGSAHVRIDSLVLTNIGTIHANGGSDLLVTDNTVTFPSGALAGYGAVWQGTSFVTVTGNHFYNVPNGAEFFNANADFNAGGPTSRAGVISAGAGHYVMSNNTCDHVAACMWGSVGYDVVITGNAANVCSDVCFDTEGSIDVVISANRAAEASNGGVSSFFYADNFLAQGNNISSSVGAPLMKVYNSSGLPTRNTGFVARGNKLTCLVVICPAFSNQAATNLTFDGNDITDGSYSLGDQSTNMSIKHNHFNSTFTAPSAWTAINTNAIINGGLLEIEDNTITGVTQPAGSICIANTSLDFNSTVTLRIIGNKCLGGFPIDLTTTNSGTNSSTGVITTLQGNWWSHNNVVHTHSTGNLDNYLELDKFILSGLNWIRAGIVAGTAYAPNFTPVSVPAASCNDQSFTVSGLTGVDQLTQLRPPTSLGNVSATPLPNGANTLVVHFCNPSATAVIPPTGVYQFMAIH